MRTRSAGAGTPCSPATALSSYLMISMYSLSLPLLSLHLRYMTDASTLAGEKVLGSLSREITLRRMVLRQGQREGQRRSKTRGRKWTRDV